MKNGRNSNLMLFVQFLYLQNKWVIKLFRKAKLWNVMYLLFVEGSGSSSSEDFADESVGVIVVVTDYIFQNW